MKHLEPNIKVNRMKGKNKPISLIFISLLVLSTLVIVYTPTLHAGTSPKTHTEVTLEPQFVSGAYPYPTQKFVINVTGLDGADVDKVEVTFPEYWEYVGHEDPDGWNFTEPTDHVATWVTDEGGGYEIGLGAKLYFNITLKPTPGADQVWTIDCTDTAESVTDSHTLSVDVSPWFHSEISPIVTNKKVSKVFTITVKNNASTSALKEVDIVYSADYTWTGDYDVPDGWSLSHNPTAHKFTLVASAATYYIKYGYEKTFKFNMTSADVSFDTTETWTVTVTNVDGVTDTLQLNTYIDVTPPTTFDWVKPTGYAGYISVNGGYIWLNITFNDIYYGADYWPTVVPNVTQLTLYSKDASSKTVGSSSTFAYKFRSATIPDGKLVVHFNITDCVGNSLTKQEVITVVDNTAPVITIAVENAQSKIENGVPVWYVGSATPTVNIWVNFTEAMQYTVSGTTYNAYDASLLSTHKIGLYINGSWQNIGSFTWDSAKKWYYAKVTGIPVEKGKCYQLFANITDAARPHNHTSSTLAYLKFDLVKPSAPTFNVQPICGGAIIRALNATDNVGVLEYKVYINTTWILVPLTDLQAPTLTPVVGNHRTFAGILVLDLADYAGKTVNITISAVDYGGNEGPGLSKVISVPVGRWYPIELGEGWNLISLPLVPTNSSIDNVLSLLLKAGLLEKVWTYDAETKTWHSYAPGAPPDLTTMVDGKGYFIKMKAYNVLIVQGTEQPAPPATPRVYHVVPGWNLIGYKRLAESKVSDYLSGVDYIRVYKFVNGQYILVRPDENMEPGLGYWVAVKTEGWIYP
jgi:hypothetical protein